MRVPTITEVIPSRHWINSRTGQRVSIYGAVPYHSDKDKAEWSIKAVGWTWRRRDGTIGLGRPAAKTYEEAVALMNRINNPT